MAVNNQRAPYDMQNVNYMMQDLSLMPPKEVSSRPAGVAQNVKSGGMAHVLTQEY